MYLKKTVWLVSLFIFGLSSSCSTTTKYVKKEIAPESIERYMHCGDRVKIKTAKLIMTMEVTGYEAGDYIVGQDQFTGARVKIPIQEIQEIHTESSQVGVESEVFEHAAHAPYVIVAPAVIPFAVVAPFVGDDVEPKKSSIIDEILSAERAAYDGMTTKEIQTELGAPENKYKCLFGEVSWYSVIYAYSDERMPDGMKYFSFSPVYQELAGVRSELPSVCSPFMGEDEELVPDPKVFSATDRQSEINQDMRFLAYATDAFSRGDTEAAYRLVEDGVVSEYPEVREKFKHFLSQHPEIHQGAARSFTAESLRESMNQYGDAAREIENRRLSIYKGIAPVREYEKALANYERVFGSM